jgi:hypothetical protein
MPRLAAAFLCTFAEERGGVVSVLSAFVNQLTTPALPTRGQVTLVADVEIEDADFGQAHIFVVTVNYEDGESLARVEIPTPPWERPPDADLDLPLHTPLIIPLVLEFRRAGRYWVALTADGEELVRRPYKVSTVMPQI